VNNWLICSTLFITLITAFLMRDARKKASQPSIREDLEISSVFFLGVAIGLGCALLINLTTSIFLSGE
jgi:cadmium resistance protein CadD (predicted permease)